MRATIKKKQ
jgi:hypothetical protein